MAERSNFDSYPKPRPGLLFDENLSARLVPALRETYPDLAHVSDAKLNGATDHRIWEYAKSRQLAIVSKDEDFQLLSDRYGQPPKVIWIRLGNCSTQQIIDLLKDRRSAIREFLADNTDSKKACFLVLE